MSNLETLEKKLNKLNNKIETMEHYAKLEPEELTKFGEIWSAHDYLPGPMIAAPLAVGCGVYEYFIYEAQEGEDISVFNNPVGVLIALSLSVAAAAVALPLGILGDIFVSLPLAVKVGIESIVNKTTNKRIEQSKEELPKLYEEQKLLTEAIEEAKEQTSISEC